MVDVQEFIAAVKLVEDAVEAVVDITRKHQTDSALHIVERIRALKHGSE